MVNVADGALPAGPLPVHRVVWLCWLEARPIVQVIFQLRFLCGLLLAGVPAGGGTLPDGVLGALAWLFGTCTIYLVNGVSDVTADRGNKSGRPIAGGALPVGVARRAAWVLCCAAVACAGLVSLPMLVLVAVVLVLGWRYSMGVRPGKDHLVQSFALVTAGGFVTYLAGWQAAGGGRLPAVLVGFAVTMALWMGLAGATKDLGDVPGDRLAGRRTLPLLVGPRSARRMIAGAAGGLGLVFLVVGAQVDTRLAPAGAVLALGGLVLAGCLLGAAGGGDRPRLRRPYHLYMITQYAAHLVALSWLILG